MSSTVAIATASAVIATQTNNNHLPSSIWQLAMLVVLFVFCKLWLFNDDVTEEDRKKYGLYVYLLLFVFSIGLMIFCQKEFGNLHVTGFELGVLFKGWPDTQERFVEYMEDLEHSRYMDDMLQAALNADLVNDR